jgi:hypothetical protein
MFSPEDESRIIRRSAWAIVATAAVLIAIALAVLGRWVVSG